MAGDLFTIKINEAQLADVKTMLRGMDKLANTVIVRAMNKTLTGVKTDASTEIRKEITATKKVVDATFVISKATASANGFTGGSIRSTGRPLPLISFSARQTKLGVSVQVKRNRSRKVIPGTFIATMKSAHKGVFWREWHGGGKASPKKKIPYGRLPREYRLPIAERFGPRVPDILSNEPIMKSVLDQADERMRKNLDHELSFEMSKL